MQKFLKFSSLFVAAIVILACSSLAFAQDAPVSTQGKTLDEIADILKRKAQEKQQKQNEEKRKKTNGKLIYKYKDSRGRWQFKNDMVSVPARYRPYVIEMQMEERDNKQPARRMKYDPEPLRRELRVKEREHKQWHERWLGLRSELKKMENLYLSLKDSPPDCQTYALGITPTSNDPKQGDCETNWRRHVEASRKKYEQAKLNLNDFMEEARRAGVPPGYLR